MLSRAAGKTNKYDNIINNTATAVKTLSQISEDSDVPFLRTVVGVTDLILTTVQVVRKNKDECMHMVEQIHEIMDTLVTLSADADGVLQPSILAHIGKFSETLQKIQAFMRTQLEQGKIKRLFKSQDNATQLEACKSGLQHAIAVFNMCNGIRLIALARDLNTGDETRQQELLARISRRNPSLSSIRSGHSYFFSDSSSSVSLLPSCPKIFHGREAELQHVVKALLHSYPACIAILGTAGIGKTTLATAALHEPDVRGKYNNIFFVSCESAESPSALVVAIASKMGIQQSGSLENAILRKLTGNDPTLLVLDNLETPWEPLQFRNACEELLSKLTDIANLSLLVTMRGAERPGKIKWTRPFLPLLASLSDIAARQTFVDIADTPPPAEAAHLAEILELSGNLPLALHLMANIVSIEGFETVLSRWRTEKTSLLSDNGLDKSTNLDRSIEVSLASPRLTSVAGARELLGLISLLPDGISEMELHECRVPLANVERCKSALLRTALGYVDHGRFKILPPIREYVLVSYPPSPLLVRPLRRYLRDLVGVWLQYQELPTGSLVPLINANFSNISAIILHSLDDPNESTDDLKATVQSIICLDSFCSRTLRGPTELVRHIPAALVKADDEQLHGQYLRHRIFSYGKTIRLDDIESLAAKCIRHFQNANDSVGEASLYTAVAKYYLRHAGDPLRAREYANRSLALSRETGAKPEEFMALHCLLTITMMTGDPVEGIKLARDCRRVNQRLGKFRGEASSITIEAQLCTQLGHLTLAAELCTQARELLVACGFENSDAWLHILDIETDVHFLRGQYSDCRRIQEAIVRETKPSHSPLYHASALGHVAYMDILLDSDEGPLLLNLDTAKQLFAEYNLNWGLLFCEARTADLHFRRGNTITARNLYQSLWYNPGIDHQLACWCLSRLGDPTLGLGSTAHTFVYFAHARKIKNFWGTYDALRCIGEVFLKQDDTITAFSFFSLALDGFTHMDADRSKERCMSRMSLCGVAASQ